MYFIYSHIDIITVHDVEKIISSLHRGYNILLVTLVKA